MGAWGDRIIKWLKNIHEFITPMTLDEFIERLFKVFVIMALVMGICYFVAVIIVAIGAY